MSKESERVQDLEQRVQELEATVRGLTEELVDANERIRQLEGEHGMHEPAERAARDRGRPASEDQPDEPADDAATDDEAPKEAEAEDETEEEDESERGDDIIVA